MPDNLSEYDNMTVEELTAVLREDLEAEDRSGLDDDTLFYVIQLYARKTDKPPKTAQEAYAVFLQDYLPKGAAPRLRKRALKRMNDAAKRQFKLKRWRAMTVVLTVMVVVLAASITVSSRHTTSWEPVYRQERDYLILSGNHSFENTVNVPPLARQWYPRWLPEGYERIRNLHNTGHYLNHYQRRQSSEDDTLNINFDALTAGEVIRYFKNPDAAKQFEHGGVEFYLYTNMNRSCAVGCLDGIVIFVEGKISEEEVLRIVRSMPLC